MNAAADAASLAYSSVDLRSIVNLNAHAPASPPDSLEETLRARFGLASFRPWQREAIEGVLRPPGRVLVVAPTGG